MKELYYFDKAMRGSRGDYLSVLTSVYDETPTKTILTNNNGNEFYFFKEIIKERKDEYWALTDRSLKLRSESKGDYLSSGFVVSEINSSLRAEGVHSTRKIVDQIIKRQNNGDIKYSHDNLEQLIVNMYECMRYIFKTSEITERNLFNLYSTMTNQMPSESIIEEQSWYRKEMVQIGNEHGEMPDKIQKRIRELIQFVNDETIDLETRAFASHYLFEDIHPYYDYNGRMGRMLHLWVLLKDTDIFWRSIFLSEAIYSFKPQFDAIFTKQKKAKDSNSNIDLTFPICSMYDFLITHTQNYLKMKAYVSASKIDISRHLRLFIIDMLCDSNFDVDKWYDINKFKELYDGYSNTIADRVLQEIRASEIFDLKEGKPIKFRLKDIK